MNKPELSSSWQRIFIAGIALLIVFSALAKGAHDVWAATAVYLALIGLVVAFIVASHRQGKAIYLPVLSPALTLLVSLFISFSTSINPSESFLSFMDWTAFLLMFFLAANIFTSESDLKILLVLLLPLFFIEFIVTLNQWLTNSYLVRHSLLPYQEPTGTFVNGNSTVAYILIWFPYVIAQSFSSFSSSQKSRWIWFGGMVSLASVLLMVLSAWSVICLLLGALVYAGKEKIGRFYKARKGFFVALFLIGTSVSVALVWVKLAMIYGWGDFHFHRIAPTSRIIWWISGLKMWKDYPWFGIGIGNFPSAFLAYKTGMGQNTLYAHSVVIQLLSETGAIGFGLVCLFMTRCVLGSRNLFLGAYKPITVGLFMFLLFSALHVSFEYLSHLMALGLVLGLMVAPTAGKSWVPRFPWTILVGGLAIASVPFLVSPFLASQLIVEGQIFMAEKKWDDARKSFESAMDLDSRAWEPYAGLARCAMARGDERAAVDYQRDALRRNKLNLSLKRELEKLEARSPSIRREDVKQVD